MTKQKLCKQDRDLTKHLVDQISIIDTKRQTDHAKIDARYDKQIDSIRAVINYFYKDLATPDRSTEQ